MLVGSFSGSTAALAGAAGATLGASASALVTGAGADTSATVSFFGSLAQAASKLTNTTPIMSFFMMFPFAGFKLRIRSPHWFACIAALRKHMLLDTTITGHSRQYTTTAPLTGKQDELAVGCKAGFLLPATFGEKRHLPGLKVLQGDIEPAIPEMGKYEILAVRAVPR